VHLQDNDGGVVRSTKQIRPHHGTGHCCLKCGKGFAAYFRDKWFGGFAKLKISISSLKDFLFILKRNLPQVREFISEIEPSWNKRKYLYRALLLKEFWLQVRNRLEDLD
jgi:hypothetical protein